MLTHVPKRLANSCGQCFSKVTNTQKRLMMDNFQSTAQWDCWWKWWRHTGISVLCLLLYSPLAISGLSIIWKNLLLVKVMTVNIIMNGTARWLARTIGTCTTRAKRNSSKKIWRVSTHGTSFCCHASYRSFTHTHFSQKVSEHSWLQQLSFQQVTCNGRKELRPWILCSWYRASL